MGQADDPCIICQETCQTAKPSLLPCTCRYVLHNDCWNQWVAAKGYMMCPLCLLNCPVYLVTVVHVNPPHGVAGDGTCASHCAKAALGCLTIWFVALILWLSITNSKGF